MSLMSCMAVVYDHRPSHPYEAEAEHGAGGCASTMILLLLQQLLLWSDFAADLLSRVAVCVGREVLCLSCGVFGLG